MPPLAVAGLAAVASIGGQYLAGKSQTKAANKAADIEANASREANALTERIYNQNAGYLSPWMTSGQTANNAIMQLLGFPAQTQPSAFNGGTGAPYAFNGSGGGNFAGVKSGMASPDAAWDENNAFYGMGTYGNMQYGQPQPVAQTVAPDARSAFDTYKGSTGYDFRFNEGTRALQSAFSRNLESGAASKAAIRFGQGVASDEFGRYMDLLRGQSQMGFGSASALAGVGQNFANTVNSSNRLAADAAANARLYSGQANSALWQGLGSSFGNVLGSLGGTSAFKVGGW